MIFSSNVNTIILLQESCLNYYQLPKTWFSKKQRSILRFLEPKPGFETNIDKMLSAKLNTPTQDVTSLALSATSVCLFHGGMISEQTATIKLKGAWNLDSTRSSTNFHFPLMPPALFASFHKVHNKVITSMKTYFSFYMLLYWAPDITKFKYT